LVFWLDAGSLFADRAAGLGNQSGTFDIANVQLEMDALSDFEVRDSSIDRGFCNKFGQRYDVAGQILAIGTGISSTQADVWFRFRAPFRAPPTLFNVYGSQYTTQAGAYVYTTTSIDHSGSPKKAEGVKMRITVSGLGDGKSAMFGLDSSATSSTFIVVSTDWE